MDKVVESIWLKQKLSGLPKQKLNIAKNCIDRHLNKRGDKTANI
jgi:acetyl-CoA synthetase